MRRFACSLALILCLAHAVCAQEITSADDKAAFGLAQSLSNLKRWEEACEVAAGLYSRYPKNRDLGLLLARALNGAGKPARAREVLEALKAEYPGDAGIRYALASMLEAHQEPTAARREYQDLFSGTPDDKVLGLKLADSAYNAGDYAGAAAHYRELSKRFPGDLSLERRLAESLLQRARRSSWDKERYEEALQRYAELIQGDPGWLTPRRERARLLGWMRRYSDSLKEYAAAAQSLPDEQGALKAESSAKGYYYRGAWKSASAAYERWLKIEPGDQEALFDYGQLNSILMRWDRARAAYEKIVKLNPGHTAARRALERVESLSRVPVLESGCEIYEDDSGDRNADVRYFRVVSRAAVPLNDRFSFGALLDAFRYGFAGLRLLQRERAGVSLSYNNRPGFWFDLGYSYNSYSDHIKNSHNAFSALHLVPFDLLEIAVSHARDDFIRNEQTLRLGIRTDDYRARAFYRPSRRLTLGADYVFSDLTDGNDRVTWGVDVVSRLRYEPRSLNLLYRYEEYGFRRTDPFYFSPGSFHTNTVGLEWRHFLNREELFWGARFLLYPALRR